MKQIIFILAIASAYILVNRPVSDISVDHNANITKSAAVQFVSNSVTGEFTLSDNQLVKEIVIYNLLGQEVKSFNTNLEKYNLNDLPDGAYMVSLKDKNKATIKTVRVNKKEIRA